MIFGLEVIGGMMTTKLIAPNAELTRCSPAQNDELTANGRVD